MTKSVFEMARNAGNNAPLKGNAPSGMERRKKLLLTPALYCDKYEELKRVGKTPLTFTAYVIEAFREKLERDGAL